MSPGIGPFHSPRKFLRSDAFSPLNSALRIVASAQQICKSELSRDFETRDVGELSRRGLLSECADKSCEISL